jgi:hypothetical protein
MEYLFIAFLPILIWLAVNLYFSYTSGWTTLAKVYEFSKPFVGKKWQSVSGKMGTPESSNWMRHSLTVGANEEGLYLSISILFRLRCPPLFIPWGDISVSLEKGILTKYIKFNFSTTPAAYLSINENVGRQVLECRGGVQHLSVKQSPS